ncbi:hypothetical protein [Pedobacter sp. HMWF019]|uniref:hypothetical protein n=1 Tax=Pedobacter sp. HMWF019 TaxID=2056856 RepID=UPI0011B25B51|nr:hypothetical protein [Pedobacter sp. HMWF019]
MEILSQYEVQTIAGKFRVDFVVELNGHKIGFECDGKNYHDAFRDEWRDGLILHTEEIDTIYRFKGKDVYWLLDDCIYIIYKNDPFIFNNRYEHFCSNLVSQATLEYFITDELRYRNHEDTLIGIDIKNEDDKVIGQLSLETIRRGKNTNGYWRRLVEIVVSNPNSSLDELIELYKQRKL